MKQPCIYIDRDTKVVDRGEWGIIRYTREHILRGFWDGEKAELYGTVLFLFGHEAFQRIQKANLPGHLCSVSMYNERQTA